MATLGKQMDHIRSFLGWVWNIQKERDVPVSLDLYSSTNRMLQFVGFLKARGVGG